MSDAIVCPDCGTRYKVGERHACAPRDPLLEERHSTHGPFIQNARISQRLKETIRQLCPGFNQFDEVYKESLDMICLKLSRIFSGQQNFTDHWIDIAGYAKLAAEHTTLERAKLDKYLRDNYATGDEGPRKD